jgi:hypothetical protein
VSTELGVALGEGATVLVGEGVRVAVGVAGFFPQATLAAVNAISSPIVITNLATRCPTPFITSPPSNCITPPSIPQNCGPTHGAAGRPTPTAVTCRIRLCGRG